MRRMQAAGGVWFPRGKSGRKENSNGGSEGEVAALGRPGLGEKGAQLLSNRAT